VANFTGTDAGDTLAGTSGDDLIEGLGGDDRIDGKEGTDTLRGGDGDDQIFGAAGNDSIEGGAGRDNLDGGFGDDLVEAGEGDDRVGSYDGSDIIHLGNGLNSLQLDRGLGTADHVVATGGDQSDSVSLTAFGSNFFDLNLGGGDDLLELTMLKSHSVLDLGAGSDRIRMWEFSSGIIGFGSLAISGFTPGAGGDRLDWNGFLANGLTGWNHSLNPFGTGHLRLRQVGDDALLEVDSNGGGNGYVALFTFKNSDSTLFVDENFDGYRPDGGASAALNLTGTDSGETFNGSGAGDTIDGGSGNDVIEGGGGNDTLHGGSGRDSLRGEVGDDILYGGADGDDLNGGFGADTLHGGDGNDIFIDDRGGDTFYGDGGNDSLNFNTSGSAGLMRAFGGEGDDRINIHAFHGGVYLVDGGVGADRIFISSLRTSADLTLGAGSDTIAIDASNPTYLATMGSIVVRDFEAGAEADKVDFVGFLSAALVGWNGAANPFAANLGFVRLLQSNADTLLQIDTNGGGNSFRTIINFKTLAPSAFTADNFGGFSPDGAAAPPQTITGTNSNDVLSGGSGDDLIEGLEGFDWLYGGSGSDELRGGGGPDLLYGETGNDRLIGGDGDGDDTLDGGQGDDVMEGGEGDDVFRDDFGSDRIFGGAGMDSIHVQRFTPATETIRVDAGEDDDSITLHTYVTGTSLEVDAGPGGDTISIMAMDGAALLTLGEGADSIRFAESYAQDRGGSVRVLDFAASAGGDRVVFIDFLTEAAPGWDGEANPFETGFARIVQSGNDTLLQFDPDAAAGVHDFFTALTLANTDAYSLTPENIGHAFPTLYGSAGNDTLVGDARANHIASGSGNDDVEGGDGDDALYGGEGADRVDGGEGQDLLDGGSGSDTMAGGDGDDVYHVDGPGDVVEENAGEGTDEVRTALATFSLAGLANVENLRATSAIAHDFRGNAGDNQVTGGGGSDFLRLYDGGKDSAYGGGGNDVILFGSAMSWTDFVDGGAGLDQLVLQGHYVNGAALLFGGGVVSIENIAILPGDDTRFGDPGTNHYDYSLTLQDSTVASGIQLVIDANRLRAGEDLTFDGSAETDGSFFIYGGAGTDILFGGANNDVFLFGAWGQWNPADVVVGGSGIDQLALRGNYSLTFGAGQLFGIENIGLLSAHDTRFGALGSSYSYDLTMVDGNVASGVQMVVDGAKLRVAEFFRFDGSAELDGSFRVFGGLVDDTIIASRNNDFLQGNGGIDSLTGGEGADTFRYLSASDSALGAADRILDFTPGTDKIDLSRIDSNSHSAGDQAFSWIGSNAFTGSGAASAGELRAFQSGASWFVEGDTDGDGNADLLIDLTLMGPTPLGPGDFLL
jgi:Ca2+-binding RTX toxin-like protein